MNPWAYMDNLMKSSTEQQAEQLWGDYAKHDAKQFWKQYDALLKKQKHKEVPAPMPVTAPMPITAPLPQRLSTQVYHNSFWRLFVEAVLANIVLTCIWFSLEFLVDEKWGGVAIIVIVFYILPWFALISNYGYFSLHPHGLLIKRLGHSPDEFAWTQIKKIELIYGRYLEIVTYGDTYSMGIAMSSKQRKELKAAIEYYINNPMPPRI